MRLSVIIVLLSFGCSGLSQNTDNLWSVWQDESQPDTARLKAIFQYTTGQFLFKQPDSAYALANQMHTMAARVGNKTYMADAGYIMGISLYQKGEYKLAEERYLANLQLHEELGNLQGKARTLNNLGILFKSLGKYTKALRSYNESLTIKRELGDKSGEGKSLGNIGIVLEKQGKYQEALERYSECLEIQESLGDQKGVASTYNNIGLIYHTLRDSKKALEYFEKSLAIYEEIDYTRGISYMRNNLGMVREQIGEYNAALDLYSQSLGLSQETGDKLGIAAAYINIGIAHKNMGDTEKALNYLNQGNQMSEDLGDLPRVSNAQRNIAQVHLELGDPSKAILHGEKALQLAQQLGNAVQINDASRLLYEAYRQVGRTTPALEMLELHSNLSDSLENVENERALIHREIKHDYQQQQDALVAEQKRKEALAKAEEQRKEDLRAEERKQQNIIIGASIGGLILVLIFAVFIVKRLRITRKQKAIIEEQKLEVDEKNKEITDSINYAQRIQKAMLPSDSLAQKLLPQAFGLYLPKDIVAGDFYWIEEAGDTVFFAAADCTGHGVPGAMMSVVCHGALNRAVREFGITDPGAILDKARELVEKTFEESDEEVKDGMDVSLVAWHRTENRVLWAGANNPLWLVRRTNVIAKSDEGGLKQSPPDDHNPSEEIASDSATHSPRNDRYELIEVKADKQPISALPDPKPYTTHDVELSEGDTLYVFTDGFPDQFGGPRGKKYKYSKFKEFLLSIQSSIMNDQRELLQQEFHDWKGGLEQVDDICIIGVKV